MHNERRQQRSNATTLYCFTPIVTLITFVVELLFALYVFIYHRTRPFGRLAGVMLLLLGLFQLSEYLLCTTAVSERLWTTTGWVAITFLPAVGVHLISLTTKPSRWVPLGYALATAFASAIVVQPSFVHSATCTGRFVAYATNTPFSDAYAIYYLGYLVLGVVMLSYALMHRSASRALHGWMLAGYAVFLIPTWIVYLVVTSARVGIPSVMCGFAVLLALILTFCVVPCEAQHSARLAAQRHG